MCQNLEKSNQVLRIKCQELSVSKWDPSFSSLYHYHSTVLTCCLSSAFYWISDLPSDGRLFICWLAICSLSLLFSSQAVLIKIPSLKNQRWKLWKVDSTSLQILDTFTLREIRHLLCDPRWTTETEYWILWGYKGAWLPTWVLLPCHQPGCTLKLSCDDSLTDRKTGGSKELKRNTGKILC